MKMLPLIDVTLFLPFSLLLTEVGFKVHPLPPTTSHFLIRNLSLSLSLSLSVSLFQALPLE
jgi:hypothetical protein